MASKKLATYTMDLKPDIDNEFCYADSSVRGGKVIICICTNRWTSIRALIRPIEITGISALTVMTQFAVKLPLMRWKEKFPTTGIDYRKIEFAVLAIIALTITPPRFGPYFLICLPFFLYPCEVLLIKGGLPRKLGTKHRHSCSGTHGTPVYLRRVICL